MTPHIRERKPGVWQIMFDVGADPVTGRRRQRSKTVYGTRAHADREAERIALELADGMFIDDRGMTVADLIEAWLTVKASQISPGSLATYRHNVKHLEPISRRKIAAINGGTLTLLYGRMLEQGHSAATVYATHRAARAMFRSAVRWGYLRDDPTFRAEVPRYRARQMTTWSGQDLATFLAGTEATPLHPAFVLLAMTGMRRGEACGLQWSDVDLTAGTLAIKRSVSVVDGRPVVGETKTTASRRTIAVDAATVEYLRALRASRPTGISGSWVFVVAKRDGSPYSPQSISTAFNRYVEQLGLPRIRLHDIRHTFASLALEAGVHIRVVADRLGHSSPALTLNTYSHSTPKLDRDAAEAVGRLVGKG